MTPPPHKAVPCCSILYLLCRFLSDPWYWGTLQNLLFSKVLWGSSLRSWFVKVLHVNYLSSFERMRKSFSDSPADTSSRTVTWASSQRLDSKAIALHLWMKDFSNHPFFFHTQGEPVRSPTDSGVVRILRGIESGCSTAGSRSCTFPSCLLRLPCLPQRERSNWIGKSDWEQSLSCSWTPGEPWIPLS